MPPGKYQRSPTPTSSIKLRPWASIAVYDPASGFLLTGDTVLPGRLYAFDFPEFVASLDLLVDFEPGASLLDQAGLFQDLEELLGVGVDVVSRSGLKPWDDHIRAEAVDL